MPEIRSVHLKIELQAGDPYVTGTLTDEGGRRHDFTTWLHLLTLLEAARHRVALVRRA